MGHGIVRLQFQRSAVTGDRSVQVPQDLQHGAQVAMEEGYVPLQRDRPTRVCDGNFILPSW